VVTGGSPVVTYDEEVDESRLMQAAFPPVPPFTVVKVSVTAAEKVAGSWQERPPPVPPAVGVQLAVEALTVLPPAAPFTPAAPEVPALPLLPGPPLPA
jgi:hypothetical protein